MDMVIVTCCNCRRIKVNGNWVKEPDFLSKELHRTHTYCPGCLVEAMETVENDAGRPAELAIGSGSLRRAPAA